MSQTPATFALGPVDPRAAIEALTAIGFQADPVERVRLSRLDTFDGRLDGAGLQLLLIEADGRAELVLSGDDVVDAHLPVDAVPRIAADLPPGPFRTRVASVIDVRALLPIVGVTATRTTLTMRDQAGKAVARASLLDGVQVDGRGGAGAPHSLVELGALVELHEVVGFPRPMRRARLALEDLELGRHAGDAVTAVARACGIDVAGFSGSPTVPLDPAGPAVEGFGLVLANLGESIEANWEGAIGRVDPEFLHDLRVALRRTRAVLAQGKAVLPPAVVATARTRFSQLASLTGPARDLDVYLIEWAGYVRPLGADAAAALQPVRRVLEVRLDDAYRELTVALRSDEAVQLRSWWRHVLAHLDDHQPQGRDADRALGRVVRKRLVNAQTTLVERARLIGPHTPAQQVHDLRKDAKKLRYLIECFGSILPDEPKRLFVKRLKAFQNNLGEHQDAEVHVALVREVALELHRHDVGPETLLAIGQLTERLEQVRLGARAEFAERFAQYDTGETQRAFDAMLDGMAR